MEDCELIDAVVNGTLPKIEDIRNEVKAQADRELLEQGMELAPPSPEREAEFTRIVWGAPLTDAAILFLWSVLSKAQNGEFVVDEESVAATLATLDEKEVKGATGFSDEHIHPILRKMAEAFLEFVRAHGTIDVEIDGQPVRLQSALEVTRM